MGRPKIPKQDNQHFGLKVALRHTTLRQGGFAQPVTVCETHGGVGRLAAACYAHADTGLVIEKDEDRVNALAFSRPSWRVYQGDAAILLAGGLGSDVVWSVLDCDPWGSPWGTLTGFFTSSRLFAPVMALIVTDGARQKERLGGNHSHGWEPWKDRYGGSLWSVYLRCSQERLAMLVRQAGYAVTWWHGRYAGASGQMTYWGAILTRASA